MNTVSLEVLMVLSPQKKGACRVFYQSSWPLYISSVGVNYTNGIDVWIDKMGTCMLSLSK